VTIIMIMIMIMMIIAVTQPILKLGPPDFFMKVDLDNS